MRFLRSLRAQRRVGISQEEGSGNKHRRVVARLIVDELQHCIVAHRFDAFLNEAIEVDITFEGLLCLVLHGALVGCHERRSFEMPRESQRPDMLR